MNLVYGWPEFRLPPINLWTVWRREEKIPLDAQWKEFPYDPYDQRDFVAVWREAQEFRRDLPGRLQTVIRDAGVAIYVCWW